MEEKATLLESLAQKAEAYAKTNVDLLKLKGVDKASDIAATIVIKVIFGLIISLIAILANFGLAYWIGSLFGEVYLGFFTVAVFYLVIAIIMYYGRDGWIRIPVKNAVIESILDEKKPE